MKYIILLLPLFFVSCNKDNPQAKADNVDISIDIFVQDTVGNNLLTAQVAGAIDVNAIRLEYLIEQNITSVYNQHWDCPYAVCYIDDPGNERIRVLPNDSESTAYPITFINWGNGDIDTLKCHFIRVVDNETLSVSCDMVWFNDLRMFPDSAIISFGRAFRIVK